MREIRENGADDTENLGGRMEEKEGRTKRFWEKKEKNETMVELPVVL